MTRHKHGAKRLREGRGGSKDTEPRIRSGHWYPIYCAVLSYFPSSDHHFVFGNNNPRLNFPIPNPTATK